MTSNKKGADGTRAVHTGFIPQKHPKKASAPPENIFWMLRPTVLYNLLPITMQFWPHHVFYHCRVVAALI